MDNPLCKCGHRLLVHAVVVGNGLRIYYGCYNNRCNCQEFREDAKMHDQPNEYDLASMDVQRTATFNVTVDEGDPIYILFHNNPKVHTITLESDDNVMTYSRDLTEDDD